MSPSISDPYFDWRGIGSHAAGCKQTRWDVREYSFERHDGTQDYGLRAICPQPAGCGVVREWSFSIAPDRDPESGDVRSGAGWGSGPVEYIGYGTAPTRCGDVWLHAGPTLLRQRDMPPDYWLVTRSAAPPETRAEVIGTVAHAVRNGRYVKARWFAAGQVQGRYGSSARESREDFTSRAAAVRWVEERDEQIGKESRG